MERVNRGIILNYSCELRRRNGKCLTWEVGKFEVESEKGQV